MSLDEMVTRRELLARGATAAVAFTGLRFAAGCAVPRDAGPAARVLVAGAGLAGLAAAYELAKRGHDVTVVEARERPGGRVYTLRGFDDGLHVEAGAVYVPDTHFHTVGYCRDLGVELAPAGPRVRGGAGERYFVRGRSVAARGGRAGAWPLALRADEQGLAPELLIARYLDPVLDQIGDPLHPAWPGAAALAYDGMSMAALLRRRGASDAAVALMRLGYMDEWGDGIASVSALFLLRDLALRRGIAETSVIAGGSDRLPHALAARLGTRIRYGAAVTAIGQNAGGVRVEVIEGGRRRVLEADRLVCAMPFPVLREIRVSPPFSTGKREAIEGLRTTPVTRVYLQLRERCWGVADAAIPTDLPMMYALDATCGQPGRRAVFEALMTGRAARRAAALSPDERLEWVRAQAERIHPGLTRRFEHGTSYAWDDDPWARGDYAWFAPGEMRAFLPHLARPEGRVHFAGDHTSAQPGWMQGALASGIRAAEEVHAVTVAST